MLRKLTANLHQQPGGRHGTRCRSVRLGRRDAAGLGREPTGPSATSSVNARARLFRRLREQPVTRHNDALGVAAAVASNASPCSLSASCGCCMRMQIHTRHPLTPLALELASGTSSSATPNAVAPASMPPADQHPAAVYLARLGAGSRRTMRAALAAMAGIVSGGAADATQLDWGALRYPHRPCADPRDGKLRDHQPMLAARGGACGGGGSGIRCRTTTKLTSRPSAETLLGAAPGAVERGAVAACRPIRNRAFVTGRCSPLMYGSGSAVEVVGLDSRPG